LSFRRGCGAAQLGHNAIVPGGGEIKMPRQIVKKTLKTRCLEVAI
jgi:hypothetical protein